MPRRFGFVKAHVSAFSSFASCLASGKLDAMDTREMARVSYVGGPDFVHVDTGRVRRW